MDEDRFDAFARTLGRTRSRRAALGLLSAAAAGSVFARPRSGEVAAKCVKLGKRCDKGDRCCGGGRCKGGKCRCTGGKEPCGRTCRVACGAGETRNPATCDCGVCIVEGPLADRCTADFECCSNRCEPLDAATSICRLEDCRPPGFGCISSFQCCGGSCRRNGEGVTTCGGV